MTASDSRNAILVGKFVNWPIAEGTQDRPPRFAGSGEVIAALEGPFLLVRSIDTDEPPFMLVLGISDGLLFFDDRGGLDKWRAYVSNDPEPIVRLAGRKKPPDM